MRHLQPPSSQATVFFNRSSEKERDVLFKYAQPDDRLSYTAAVGIGSAEIQEDLIEDTSLWFEGNIDGRTVILIDVEEMPQ